MARLKARKGSEKRLSPITGEPMEQLTLMGVVIDRCPSSGGVWLDAGELEEIIKSAKSQGADQETTLSQFFSNLFNLNSKR
ncbi:MAG: hypothetical protein DCC75_10985 [Proteobacteria bacterium]|nr:MAG: hypothetical protein DCC75_10985 [Pseudomonadota bacterium]